VSWFSLGHSLKITKNPIEECQIGLKWRSVGSKDERNPKSAASRARGCQEKASEAEGDVPLFGCFRLCYNRHA
jgi:hypothetical protein